ncbi:Atypical/ABC1/ABC1-A protein kinase [Cryptococcus neoformans var. grubii H99]|uniref:Atypical/ABC1/ABC1-A protein kinase n=1 Tax=Cryptococcus neoformans (strain H99 / ATCC 208821 / CBS 10515 / FGSC 9487) TaxID=235443 RepID=J9VUJ8_CRYN9|nr:Atypical/ABC1/ABC1-A protein kinase [Cryptococcus neoformans var. grubii H99]AFR95375.2 Atypical/ABC1/ABC1-A protein kinase [Cryptococcus neoformans var. grubii H99]AUB25172.1 Atypical/ABC1/ABC1-A protein kinase [Cryptococcus neoformans var. grubii]|eukprot:XP_012049710.1 Atypical/ABC1/ABC1-A protein kinase [Cryptococcus neoformans var. grubii H99]
MHTTMLSAALRVLARSAAIQRGEAGTAAATATTAAPPPLSRAAALDRLINAAPHLPPPPAPGTHPADKGHGIPLPLSLKAGHRGPVRYVQPESRPTPNAGPSTSARPPEPARPAKPVRPANTMEPAKTVDADKPPQPVPPIVQELDAGPGIKNHPVEPLITLPEDEETPVILRASRVPASRLGRLFHYGSLAASLSWGAASESIRRSTAGNGGEKSGGSVFMSDANIRRLVSTLGRMRGAALKLGQFMSIQDNHMLPPEIEQVLHQVQAHANYMPDWQMDKVLRDELGADWQANLFTQFDRTPIASASIGQVHRAILKDGRQVAVKIQFPGVASSIESDLSNLSLLLRTSALLPKGLYLQNTIAVMRRELEDECDYIREAAAGKKFAHLLAGDTFFVVPQVIDEATTGKVLTTEWMDGKPLSRVKNLSQETRDLIGTNILRLCLRELFQFRFMQTDPNWANFLFSPSSPSPSPSSSPQIQLIDFGASREYTKEFMDGWYRLLKSALEGDRERMRVESLNLGYLTGEENDEMVQAHLDSMALVASPFSHHGPYPFAKQTITESIRALIPIMLKHRLTPPPQETYSLNRKLSGAFLMCAKMRANVDCKKLWEEEVGGYKEG